MCRIIRFKNNGKKTRETTTTASFITKQNPVELEHLEHLHRPIPLTKRVPRPHLRGIGPVVPPSSSAASLATLKNRYARSRAVRMLRRKKELVWFR